jgi:hypothetical protein
MLRRVVSYKLTNVTEMLATSIIRAMEAVNTSETSVSFYETTWRNSPEDSHLHTRHPENLKSHKMIPNAANKYWRSCNAHLQNKNVTIGITLSFDFIFGKRH